jgi:hypothetical protein
LIAINKRRFYLGIRKNTGTADTIKDKGKRGINKSTTIVLSRS